MKRLVLAVLTSVILGASAVAAFADTASEDRGFIGVFYPHISFRGDDQPDTGDGAGIRIGGTKGRVFGAFLSAFRTRHDDGTGRTAEFTGLTGDLKLSVPLFKVVAPYVSAGIGRYVLETSDTVLRGNQEGSGVNGFQVGAGLDIHLSELFTFTVGYTKRRMEFDRGTPGEMVRVELGHTPGDNEVHQQIREFDLELSFHFH